jgi:Flp pilus assembly pilin Flp
MQFDQGHRDGARSQRGASLVEYVLLVMLIAVIVLTAVKAVGVTTSGKWSSTTSEVQTW